MAALELAAVLSLSTACVPADLPKLRQRMVAHAMVESGFDPLAIHDNGTKAVYRPRSIEEAQRIISSLRGHSLDAGIAQVTRANWEKTGLRSPRLLFNATANFCAGAIILAQDYEAACRYNRGQPNCEPRYPAAVDHAQSVIRNMARDTTAEIPVDTERPFERDPCADIPTWDLWAVQECREQHQENKE